MTVFFWYTFVGDIVNLYDLKNRIKNNLLIINDNLDRCVIKVSGEDIEKVNNLLETDDLEMLKQCSNEMDDIINGIIINIDSELKKILEESTKENDLVSRKEILDKIISITDSIKYETENKSYFMGIIKKIYININGEDL